MSTQGPIADLTYRNYDGPKNLGSLRWWVITRSGIRSSIRKKGFWVLAGCAMIPSLLAIIFGVISNQIAMRRPEVADQLPNLPESFAAVFGAWYWVFFISLLVGAAIISADNRANALQVYLSKPITKWDYLIGKWMTVFIMVYLVGLAPLILSLLYGAFNEGLSSFFSNHLLLVPKVLLLPAIPAFVHSSLLCGISAWNKTPWAAGLIYAGIFTFWNSAMFIIMQAMGGGGRHTDQAIETIRSLSIQGSISGLGFNLIGSMPREFIRTGERFMPSWSPMFLLLAILCAIGIWMAYARIRAVEVIQG